MFLELGLSNTDRAERSARYYNYFGGGVTVDLLYTGGNRFADSPIRLNWGSVHRAGQLDSWAVSSPLCRMNIGLTNRIGDDRTCLGHNLAMGDTRATQARGSRAEAKVVTAHEMRQIAAVISATGREFRTDAVNHYDEE